MCHTLYKYGCGHARKQKEECRRRGPVSSFIKRVLYDEVCEDVRVKKRDRICRMCSANQKYQEETHQDRHGRSKTAEGSHRDDHHRRPSKDHHGSRHRRRSRDRSDSRRHHPDNDHYGSSRGAHRGHQTKRSHGTDRSEDHHSSRDHHGSEPHRPGNDNHSSSSDSRPTEPRRRHRVSEPTGYATQNAPEGWNAAQANIMMGWMNSSEAEHAGAYQAARAPIVPDSYSYGQHSATAPDERDLRGSATAGPSQTTAAPSNNDFTPARAGWGDLPPLPKTTYRRPSAPPRPASSVYPDAPPPPSPTTYSAAHMSDFVTVYVDSEVKADIRKQKNMAPASEFANQSCVPDPLFPVEEVTGRGFNPAVQSQKPAHFQGYSAGAQRQNANQGKSRYANLPATESEFCRQEDRKDRLRRAEEEARKWEEEQNAELRRDQEILREDLRQFVAQQEAERERQQREEQERLQYEEQMRRLQEQQHQQHQQRQYRQQGPPPPLPAEPRRPSTGGTYPSRGAYGNDRPGLWGAHAEPPRWDSQILQRGPAPTPSTVGSQFLMNPRMAPAPGGPPPPPPNGFGRSANERRVTQISDFLPAVPVNPPSSKNFRSVDPRVIEANWGAQAGQPTGKRSENTSKSKEAPGLFNVKNIGQRGRNFFGKLHLHKEPSEESFLCQGAREHDSMNEIASGRKGSRRKR